LASVYLLLGHFFGDHGLIITNPNPIVINHFAFSSNLPAVTVTAYPSTFRPASGTYPDLDPCELLLKDQPLLMQTFLFPRQGPRPLIGQGSKQAIKPSKLLDCLTKQKPYMLYKKHQSAFCIKEVNHFDLICHAVQDFLD